MTDVYFKGPDVKRLLARTGINSFATFGHNKAKQFIAVNHDGYMISDAILFGLEDDEVNLVGTPLAANWAQFVAAHDLIERSGIGPSWWPSLTDPTTGPATTLTADRRRP